MNPDGVSAQDPDIADGVSYYVPFHSWPAVAIREFVERMCTLMYHSHLSPDVFTRFFEKYKIPGVIGCFDCTCVTMVRPSENEERHYCRKGNHARNIQLIIYADLNILPVDATYGGATHDNFIFDHSIIQNHLEDLVNDGETVHLLGCFRYAQRAYLMGPVPNVEEGTPATRYNKLYATARNTEERAIGRLKGRFRFVLVHRVLHYHPDVVAKIVVACCVLHNICNRAGLPAPALHVYDCQEELRFHTFIHTQAGARNETISQEAIIEHSSRQEVIKMLKCEHDYVH